MIGSNISTSWNLWLRLMAFNRFSILLQLNNATAVAYVNKRGGSRSSILNKVALDIISWCEKANLEIQAVYITGSFNFIADKESKRRNESRDWKKFVS